MATRSAAPPLRLCPLSPTVAMPARMSGRDTAGGGAWRGVAHRPKPQSAARNRSSSPSPSPLPAAEARATAAPTCRSHCRCTAHRGKHRAKPPRRSHCPRCNATAAARATARHAKPWERPARRRHHHDGDEGGPEAPARGGGMARKAAWEVGSAGARVYRGSLPARRPRSPRWPRWLQPGTGGGGGGRGTSWQGDAYRDIVLHPG